ncbi:hypothetical protein HF086_017426 [Spodoptera exigua]|uniref:Alpha-macroglobulin-like TED domain-containing protein n=1 Tax=Spodoptera exigua TaxID=7107 RepID=A0A922MF08_SPOEX|nr:hypothetical protein HF086_017426 [Spodoptera exigua]
MLVIRLRGAGGGSGGIRTAVQLRAPKACHRHAAAAKRVGLDGTDPPDVVEEGTRIWQNTTVVSQVVDKPISLEFLTKHRAVISPGLPYRLKVKATRWDDKPATKELIRVCRHQANFPDKQQLIKKRETMCAEGATDDNGIARLLIFTRTNYPNWTSTLKSTKHLSPQAQLSNDTSIVAAPLTLPVRRSSSVHAALGPLKAESRQARTFVPLYLNTNNTSKPFTVHFVVITRGGIIYRWGATTQCPTSNSGDQIRTAARNTKCPDLVQRDVVMTQRDHSEPQTNTLTAQADNQKRQYRSTGNFTPRNPRFQIPEHHQDVLMKDSSTFNISTDVSDALLDRHQLRVMLPIKVSHQMCPDSHLIAYFYHEGELVEATWLNRQAQPGSTVTLQISTPGPALCALTVLDTAAKWTQPPQPPKEQLMNSLRRLIDSHRNLTEFDAAGVCFLNSDTLELPSSSIDLTASWLAAAGVRLIGGDAPNRQHCIPRPPALLVAEETNAPRSDFSEAWLWRLLGIGSNGTGVATAHAPDSITKYEAGAICVSRNGVAISPPAVLQLLWPNLQVPTAIIRAERWLLNQQMENGCFRNEGQVFHRELKGGLNDEGEVANVALTAYVITALIESASPFPHRVIRNTLSCLRALPPMKAKTPTRVYANALLAYAYMKLDRYEEELRYTNEASLRRMVGGLEQDEGIKHVLNLMKMAKKNGEYVWWETRHSSSPGSIVGLVFSDRGNQPQCDSALQQAGPPSYAAARSQDT